MTSVSVNTLATLYIQHQLIHHEAMFFWLVRTTYTRASTSDITTVLVIGSNRIFQEAGYFEYSNI